MTLPIPDPVEQRDKVLAQITRWREQHRRKPNYLLEVQLAALLRLVDRLDDVIGDEPPNLPTRPRKDGRHDQTGR